MSNSMHLFDNYSVIKVKQYIHETEIVHRLNKKEDKQNIE